MIWGEIKGSGASPDRTVADLAGPATKGTCPSRKFPCKHGLGLMLVEAAGPIADGRPPDWVAAWTKGRESRAAAAETKAAEPGKAVDEKAQAKRRQAREDKVAAALDELDLWLRDLMRRGLAAARAEPFAFWDRMAVRLVDGQAPGLARRVRAARRLEALAPEQAAGSRAALGYPVSAEEMAARPDHTDDWAVLAHAVEEEDRLTARSVWLVGRRTGAVAQVLDYGTAGSPLPAVPAVPAVPAAGQDFCGALAFQPGDPPLRAVFRDGRAGPATAPGLPGGGSGTAARDAFADLLARAPWTERWPVRLAGMRLGRLPAPADRPAPAEPARGRGRAPGRPVRPP